MLTVDRLEHPVLSFEGLSADFSSESRPSIRFERLRVGEQRWRRVELHCDAGGLSGARLWCRDGRLTAGARVLLPGRIDLQADLLGQHVALAIRLPDGGRIELGLNDARLEAQVEALALGHLAALLPGLQGWSPAGSLGGRLSWPLGEEAVFTGQLVDGAFTSADGLQAGEALAVDLSISLNERAGSWHWRAELDWHNGAVYVDPVYVEARLGVSAEGTLSADRLDVVQAVLALEGVEQLALSASIDLAEGRLDRAAVSLVRADASHRDHDARNVERRAEDRRAHGRAMEALLAPLQLPPPFSTGETGRFGSTSRREIGHGNLAECALKVMLPDEAEFPYTIRIVSDILESNGSSSMATVCAGALSLMAGGVPLKKPVAGIAMGLIKDEASDRVAILSDILGDEDHLGDMDFKVTGTTDGITACQMDIKIQGISLEVMRSALDQAREGRMHILGIMAESISEARADLSPFAPRLTTIQIPVEMIGAAIGTGGETIRGIVAESGAEISIEEDVTVVIAAVSGESSQKAVEMIRALTEQPEPGKVYRGKVSQIREASAVTVSM